MRKILSLVLVLALVLGSFAFTFAAAPSDVIGEDCEDAVNVLKELGVVSGYPDGSFKPAGIVTRGEMAKFVIAALGLEDYAAGTSGFSDMAGNWSDKYVAYAVSLGIINGYPDGTFKPNNTVSYDEAAKMLVAALGYTPDSLVGAWPVNWVTKAKVLGILDGIKAGSAGANRGDIAIMVYQTLDQSIGKTDKDGVWTATMLQAGPPAVYDLMLDRLGAELYAPAGGVAGDAFVLDETMADEAVANIRHLVGAYITAYVNSDDEIIAIKEVKSVFLTGEFDAAMGANGWTAGDVFEGTDKDYDLIGNALNNAPTAATAVAPVEFVNGSQGAIVGGVVAGVEYKIAADVSGVKIKEVYSVSEWTIDADFMFEDGDLEDDNIANHNFTLNNNDDIDLGSFALIGVDSLEDIDEDNVVYIYKSGGEITRIEVGTETIEGEVTRISSDAEKITVNGKAYEYADDNFTALTSAVGNGGVKLEDEVVLYLDVNGYIYEMDVNPKTGGNFAIVLMTEDAGTGLSGSDALLKLFLSDGTDKTFDVDGDLALAGVIAAGGDWLGGFDAAGFTAGGALVEYGVDNDGVIDYLVVYNADAADADGDNYFAMPATDKELTSKMTYNGVPVSSNAVLFTVDVTDPAFDATDEDFYGVTTVAKAKGSEFQADYYAENNSISVMVINGTGVDTDNVYGVVTGWAKTTASSTDYIATMLVDGVETEYDIKTAVYTWLNTPANAAKTKIFEITVNTAGEVTALTDVSAGVATEIDVLATLTPSVAYTNGALDGITVDSDAIAYMMETGETEFIKVAISKANLVGMTKVVLYDTDEDLIADLLLITE